VRRLSPLVNELVGRSVVTLVEKKVVRKESAKAVQRANETGESSAGAKVEWSGIEWVGQLVDGKDVK
jgi:hypothetical protein